MAEWLIPGGDAEDLWKASRASCGPVLHVGDRGMIGTTGWQQVLWQQGKKATITVDRAKLSQARAVLGQSFASAAIDVALTELIRRRVLHDVQAYTRMPSTDEEVALAETVPDWSELADDTDWDAEWPEDR